MNQIICHCQLWALWVPQICIWCFARKLCEFPQRLCSLEALLWYRSGDWWSIQQQRLHTCSCLELLGGGQQGPSPIFVVAMPDIFAVKVLKVYLTWVPSFDKACRVFTMCSASTLKAEGQKKACPKAIAAKGLILICEPQSSEGSYLCFLSLVFNCWGSLPSKNRTRRFQSCQEWLNDNNEDIQSLQSSFSLKLLFRVKLRWMKVLNGLWKANLSHSRPSGSAFENSLVVDLKPASITTSLRNLEITFRSPQGSKYFKSMRFWRVWTWDLLPHAYLP